MVDHWYLKSIEQERTETGEKITISTNIPCHLWMRWTLIEPKIHRVPITRRGLTTMSDLYFCFDVYTDNEQEEEGDTLIHTFVKEPWPFCEKRWFYFHGEINGTPSPSTSGIFHKHPIEPILLPPLTIDCSGENFYAWGPTIGPYEDAHEADGIGCRPNWEAIYSRQVNEVGDKWAMYRAAFVFDTRELDPARPINKATLTFMVCTKWWHRPFDMYFVDANDLTLPATLASFHELLAYRHIVLTLKHDEFSTNDVLSLDLDDPSVINPGHFTIIGIMESEDFDSNPGYGEPLGSDGMGADACGSVRLSPYLTLR